MYWNKRKYELTIPLYESSNFSNINVAPGYNKLQVYYHHTELVPETDLDPLIADPATIKISDDEDKTNGKDNPEGYYKEYDNPTQFMVNGVKRKTTVRQTILLLGE